MAVELSFERCNVPLIPSSALTQLSIQRHNKQAHDKEDEVNYDNIGPEQTRYMSLKFHRY